MKDTTRSWLVERVEELEYLILEVIEEVEILDYAGLTDELLTKLKESIGE